ncbi:MAG: terpene cyclase/mutase family protein [Planctomycetes bacterium]|nr:terpene cyclase/mutase family protein [Planctomycetota bacterium]
MRWVLACSLLILAGCPQSPDPQAQATPAFDLAQARALIPEAASMPLEELERVASAPVPPTPESFAERSVTVQFLNARRGLLRPDTKGFEWLAQGTTLTPAAVVELFTRSKDAGWASFVQAEDLRSLTLVDSDPGTAQGSVAFEVADTWRGELGFKAEHRDGAWRVVELTLPELDIFSRLGADGTWTRFHADPAPGAVVGVRPALDLPCGELAGGDSALPDLTGLVSGFPDASQTLTRLTVHVPVSRPPSLVGTERDAEWRGFELPRNGRLANGTPTIDLNEVRIKLLVVDPSGRPRQGAAAPDDRVQLKVGDRVLEGWDALGALLEREARSYTGGNPSGLPVIVDARAKVPACYPIAALGVALSRGLAVTLAAPEVPYDRLPEERPGADWTRALRSALQLELAGLPAEGLLPQAGVRIHAAATAPWSQVCGVLDVCMTLRLYRVTFATKLGDVQVDLAQASGSLEVQPTILAEEEYDEDLGRTPRIDADTPVEKPIIILEEEVEVTADPPRGVDLSDTTLDSDSVVDAYGVGGGAAGSYAQRFGKGSLAREGGSPATEHAVTAALGWLKRHQSPNGSWDSDGWSANCSQGTCDGAGTNAGDARLDVGVTSLALLAFLGNGHSHRFGPFKRTVNQGLRWLKQQQRADGSVGFDPSHGESTYHHALATLVLCEAYAITRDFTLKRYAEKAVEFCLAAQNPGLAWKYGVKSGRNDTSVTGWMVLALKAAKVAELQVPDAAFEGARAWFLRATDSEGRVGYESPGGGSSYLPATEGQYDEVPSMTAVSVLCRIACGERAAEGALRKGAQALAASPPQWAPGEGTRRVNFYYWYYASNALFQVGGARWQAWNAALQEALLPNQRTGGCEDGSWDPVGEWCLSGGRVFATAINALTLEVYYRHERAE